MTCDREKLKQIAVAEAHRCPKPKLRVNGGEGHEKSWLLLVVAVVMKH